jgi:hypothetical protein
VPRSVREKREELTDAQNDLRDLIREGKRATPEANDLRGEINELARELGNERVREGLPRGDNLDPGEQYPSNLDPEYAIGGAYDDTRPHDTATTSSSETDDDKTREDYIRMLENADQRPEDDIRTEIPLEGGGFNSLGYEWIENASTDQLKRKVESIDRSALGSSDTSASGTSTASRDTTDTADDSSSTQSTGSGDSNFRKRLRARIQEAGGELELESGFINESVAESAPIENLREAVDSNDINLDAPEADSEPLWRQDR